MDWLFYVICGVIILLAIYIFVKRVRNMLKGKCCDDCKHCSAKGSCHVNDEDKK